MWGAAWWGKSYWSGSWWGPKSSNGGVPLRGLRLADTLIGLRMPVAGIVSERLES